MGKGKLVEIPAYAKEKVEKTELQKRLSKWQSSLIRGLKANLTFGQCAVMYKRETGEFPQSGWPGAYEAGSLLWKRLVRQELTMPELCRQIREVQR